MGCVRTSSLQGDRTSLCPRVQSQAGRGSREDHFFLPLFLLQRLPSNLGEKTTLFSHLCFKNIYIFSVLISFLVSFGRWVNPEPLLASAGHALQERCSAVHPFPPPSYRRALACQHFLGLSKGFPGGKSEAQNLSGTLNPNRNSAEHEQRSRLPPVHHASAPQRLEGVCVFRYKHTNNAKAHF